MAWDVDIPPDNSGKSPSKTMDYKTQPTTPKVTKSPCVRESDGSCKREVSKALDKSNKREVAAKEMKNVEEAKEDRLLVDLRHPNIITYGCQLTGDGYDEFDVKPHLQPRNETQNGVSEVGDEEDNAISDRQTQLGHLKTEESAELRNEPRNLESEVGNRPVGTILTLDEHQNISEEASAISDSFAELRNEPHNLESEVGTIFTLDKPQNIRDLEHAYPFYEAHYSDSLYRIITPGEWLQDPQIDQAMALLRKDYPKIDGLQSCRLYTTQSNSTSNSVPKLTNFIQIMHVDGNHWICVSTRGCSPGLVTVYDSLSSDNFDEERITLFARTIMYIGKFLTIQYQPIQKQIGNDDCGLFAIANTKALCDGLDPSDINWDQNDLRPHLLRCFKDGKLDSFAQYKDPVNPERLFKKQNDVQLYCVCRQAYDDNKDMVQCAQCKEWYHAVCVSVPAKAFTDKKFQYFCSVCDKRSKNK